MNCDKGKAEQSLWAGILPAYVPDYKLDSIAPEPEPVKVRAETRTARLQFRQDSYNILPGFTYRMLIPPDFSAVFCAKDAAGIAAKAIAVRMNNFFMVQKLGTPRLL